MLVPAIQARVSDLEDELELFRPNTRFADSHFIFFNSHICNLQF